MNVTPMIDVLLVLVVIFMILTALSRETIPVQVPPPAVAAPAPATQLVLSHPGAGGYELNQQPVPREEPGQVLRNALAGPRASLVIIDAAPTGTYQEVIEAVDIAKGAGIQVVAFMPSRQPVSSVRLAQILNEQ